VRPGGPAHRLSQQRHEGGHDVRIELGSGGTLDLGKHGLAEEALAIGTWLVIAE
jgi:hypothetical protein